MSLLILYIIIGAVMYLMYRTMHGKMYSYTCSQCGSANGKHADHCSFKKLDDD